MIDINLTKLFINGSSTKDTPLHTHITAKSTSLYTALSTSYGPLGLDKMLISSLGDTTLTNDGATIMKKLADGSTDPFQKIISNLSSQIDTECGDGTTTVVLLAVHLIKSACEMIESGLHPSIIANGYKLAYRESLKYLKELQIDSTRVPKILESIIRTTLSSKVVSNDSEHFVKMLSGAGKTRFLKKMGGSMKDSYSIPGYALNCKRLSNNMPRRIKNAKILCIDFDLKKVRLPLNVTVTTSDPSKMGEMKKAEERIALERIKKILDSGVNVILTSKGIDESLSKSLSSIIAVRRVEKSDLEKVASICNTTVLRTMSDLEGNDSLAGTTLGTSDSVYVEVVGEDEMVVIYSKKISSIILRGATENLLDEMERSMVDCLGVIKRMKESKFVLPGGGAVELGLFLRLMDFMGRISTKEHIPINKFAEGILSLPRRLAENAGVEEEIIGECLKRINADNRKGLQNYWGMNLVKATIENNLKEGILEPVEVKMKGIRAATEAAISILRIDEMIVVDSEKRKNEDECH